MLGLGFVKERVSERTDKGEDSMCLSAQVSFAASVFLVGGGTAISIVAWRRNKRYLPLALMPLFAGLQQFTEGFVWVGMNGNDPLTVLWGAMAVSYTHLRAHET